MSQSSPSSHRVLPAHELGGAERYQLLTSLVVPRPIGWISTRSRQGAPNLAPFSYFNALSSSPMLVGASIGHRRSGPKDSLVNIRDTGAFCVNVVTERHLEAMNASSGDHPPGVNEFEVAGLAMAEAGAVDAPYVADCPAVLECSLRKVVELEGAPNTLVVGRVRAIRVSEELDWIEGTRFVDTGSLRPVGRLWGGAYALLGEIVERSRPEV